MIKDLDENLQKTDDDPAEPTEEETFNVEEAIGFMLFEANGIIGELDPDSFSNEKSSFELACAINDVFTMLDEGMYFESIVMLENDILQRMDGCANTGEPDEDDWIRSIEDQVLLCPLLMETIKLLESML
jgi:hypothetical protein